MAIPTRFFFSVSRWSRRRTTQRAENGEIRPRNPRRSRRHRRDRQKRWNITDARGSKEGTGVPTPDKKDGCARGSHVTIIRQPIFHTSLLFSANRWRPSRGFISTLGPSFTETNWHPDSNVRRQVLFRFFFIGNSFRRKERRARTSMHR